MAGAQWLWGLLARESLWKKTLHRRHDVGDTKREVKKNLSDISFSQLFKSNFMSFKNKKKNMELCS